MINQEKTKEELHNDLLNLQLKYDSLHDMYEAELLKNTTNEKQLEATENLYKLMVENAPISYQSLDSETRFLYVNKAWLKTLGYERDEVIGHRFGEFMTPESKEMIKIK